MIATSDIDRLVSELGQNLKRLHDSTGDAFREIEQQENLEEGLISEVVGKLLHLIMYEPDEDGHPQVAEDMSSDHFLLNIASSIQMGFLIGWFGHKQYGRKSTVVE